MKNDSRLIEEFFHNSSTALALLDPRLNFVCVNDAYAKHYGNPADFFVGKNYLDLHPEDRPRATEIQESSGRYTIEAPQNTSALTDMSGATFRERTFEPVCSAELHERGILLSEVDVTERVQLRQSLDRSQKLLDAIARTHENHDRFEEPSDVFNELLDEVINLSGSEHGFIGELLQDPNGNPVMKVHSIFSADWTEDTNAFYETHAPRNMEFTNMNTLYGEVIRTGEVVIANDPGNDPRSGGAPEGHPVLNAFLGLPFNRHGSVQGIIGLANRPNGYDQPVVDFIQPLLRGYETLINAVTLNKQKRHAEAALMESDRQVIDMAIPAMENEHQGLIDLINDCYAEMSGQNNREEILRMLGEIYTEISTHFQHEERLMARISYPESSKHKASHENLLHSLRGHMQRFADNPDPDQAVYTMQQILAEWFGHHFSTLDLRLQQHLEEHHGH